jgi:hypothetical protein
LAVLARCSSPGGGSCNADQDGVNGGNFVFDLTVDDDAFAPRILTAQNLANVELTLTNKGTMPHGFAAGCVATPNDNGCPTEACFSDAASIAPIQPDASATIHFVTPNPDGLSYPFHSTAPGDTQTGQFIVQ